MYGDTPTLPPLPMEKTVKDELVEIVARGLHARSFSILGSMCDEWEDFKPDALAALRAIEGAGMKVVGRGATGEMVNAIDYAILTGAIDDDQRIWQAAFDAAPAFGGG